jgi:hypothetical protein
MNTQAATARIQSQLGKSFAHLEANGTSSSVGDAFEAFLVRPGTLRRESLIVRCRFDGQAFTFNTVVDRETSRLRFANRFQPCLQRIKARLAGPFDVFVLLSDSIYVGDSATGDFIDFIRRVPFLRCDWLEEDTISSNALVIPDFWLLDSDFDGEIAEIEQAARQSPFEQRKEIIKWRGRLSGPGYPDLSNCVDFPRYKLVLQTLHHPEFVDARLTNYRNFSPTPSGDALKRQLDSWFGGVAPEIRSADFAAYKYLISTDAVTSSWKRVATILWTGSVLLMQRTWRQFFYPGLVAWEHYVPVANDLSDLVERYDWLRANPKQAESIARTGHEFARHVLTRTAIDDCLIAMLNRCAGLLRT